jgi:hypothetical protein
MVTGGLSYMTVPLGVSRGIDRVAGISAFSDDIPWPEINEQEAAMANFEKSAKMNDIAKVRFFIETYILCSERPQWVALVEFSQRI